MRSWRLKGEGFPRSHTCLLLAGELLVGDVCGQVGVEHSAEGQAVVPAAAEVCDVNVLKNKATIRLNFDLTRQNIYSPWQKSMENQFRVLSELRGCSILPQLMNVTASHCALQAPNMAFNNIMSHNKFSCQGTT